MFLMDIHTPYPNMYSFDDPVLIEITEHATSSLGFAEPPRWRVDELNTLPRRS